MMPHSEPDLPLPSGESLPAPVPSGPSAPPDTGFPLKSLLLAVGGVLMLVVVVFGACSTMPSNPREPR
ncbi:hypothetical protein J8C07_02225 [Chloracidobacterium sp. S]|uniref:hypothetical protein n=1 Tax=Chloracidobacterium aggregatum TaxID=2851959 RepID=UPI001B8D3ED4|nr:hypothetical protein [Chloracidobacterium aggregatum]QUV88169.1 hypothetical protein J8C07_02225 [Chloracidobacterium sp. S]